MIFIVHQQATDGSHCGQGAMVLSGLEAAKLEPWSPISCWMEGIYQGLALLFHNGLLAGHFVTQSLPS